MAGAKRTTENALPNPEADTTPVNLGTLTEQPTVHRDPTSTKLEDGAIRVNY